MTMVEDKETEVRSMCPPSSDCATIVPIKKRRFPLIEPPSLPPEDPCPILKEDEKQQESTSVSQVSAILNITTEECKPENLTISQGAGASSALQQSENVSVNQDKLEHLSVEPELTNRGSCFDYSIGVTKSECHVTDLCTNRSNWDLNTTMDAWEGPAGEAMLISTDHLHEPTAACGDQVFNRPLGSSTEMAGLNVTEEQSAAEHQSAEVSAASSVPSTDPQTHEDSFRLGLQVPLLSTVSFEPPFLSPGIDPNTIFSRVSSASSSSIVPPVAVKLEPDEETQRQASPGSVSGDLRPSVEMAVKHDTVDQVGPEIDCGSLKLLNPRPLPVKTEPYYEATTVTSKTNEETSNRLEQMSEDMVLESCSKVTEPLPVNCPVVNESQTITAPLPVNCPVVNESQRITEPLPVNCPVVNESQTITEPLPVNCPVVNERQTISNCVKDGCLDKEDNEYEDGEVQDQIVADVPAGPMEATPKEIISKCEGEPDNMEFAGYQCADSSLQNKEDTEMKLYGEEEENLDEKSQMSADLDAHLQDLSDVELDSDTNESAIFSQGTIAMHADENPMIHTENARISHEATTSDHEVVGAFSQEGEAVKTENNMSQDDAEKNDSILPKAESSVNSDAVGRDSNMESNRSRIINLSATFNMPSSGKTNSASDRSMPLHDGRKRLPNVALEGDKLHLRGRNEVGNADFHRFPRERNRDMFPRNYRSNFARDRGRVPSNMCSDWESEQDFGSEMRNGPLEFRPTRYRCNLEYRNYNVSPEDGFVGTGRGGHKLLNDNSRYLHSPNSLRRAHGGRDGPATRGPPMVSRLPRNMNPSRCISMDDSELVGVRHGFVRRERNIGSFSGKGLNRIHSKSPVRLRNRSPIQWSSPRRRSPEGYAQNQEMVPRRSPMYRRERMGSPDRACFHGEAMMRQQNSPPSISHELDDMREMNSRDRNFSRSMMHNGSSSTRGFLRTRRYDTVNSRERTHREYLRVPMRGVRFHELSGDENTDERTGMNEKRGSVRHFRPHCDSENKGFSYSGDDSSRSYRLCSEDDSVYHEGGNSRERKQERHWKNESGDTYKTRKIEHQEGSFRQGVGDELDDMPRHKRERF